MKILGCLINLVPYHIARWSAVANLPGTEVAILQMRARDDFKILESSISQYPFAVHTLGIEEKTTRENELLTKVSAVFDRVAPDVVVLNGYSFPICLALLSIASRRKIPAVVCSESNQYDFQRKWLTEKIKSRIVKLCRAGLVGGTPQKNYLVELGLPATRVFHGYNAVDNSHFSNGANQARQAEATLRAQLKLPRRYFLAVARFTEKKNLRGLIDAYSDLPVPAPDLVILGDGPLRAELEKQISDLQLTDRVHFPGPIGYEDLPIYYGLAAAFIHASTTEQWGLVVNEAMAAGLPVAISDRCGCAEDLVKKGVNGQTFSPHQRSEITASLKWLANLSPDEFLAAGKASVEIIDRWSPEKFAAGLVLAISAAGKANPPRIGWIDHALVRLLMKRQEQA